MQPIVPYQLKQCDTTKVPFIDVCVILLCFILSKQTDFMHKTGDCTNQIYFEFINSGDFHRS